MNDVDGHDCDHVDDVGDAELLHSWASGLRSSTGEGGSDSEPSQRYGPLFRKISYTILDFPDPQDALAQTILVSQKKLQTIFDFVPDSNRLFPDIRTAADSLTPIAVPKDRRRECHDPPPSASQTKEPPLPPRPCTQRTPGENNNLLDDSTELNNTGRRRE